MFKSGSRIVPAIAVFVGAVLVVVAAAVAWSRWPRPVDKGAIPVAQKPRVTPASQTTTTPSTSTTLVPKRREATVSMRPVSLQIPSLGVNAPIVPVEVDQTGSLGVPGNIKTVGWWANGPPPGAPKGTAVLDGHVDSAVTGLGALFHLQSVKLGAKITVTGSPLSASFQVVAVRMYQKVTLPWKQIFAQNVVGRLVLVTCGGAFNYTTHHYADNVVVFAEPTPAS